MAKKDQTSLSSTKAIPVIAVPQTPDDIVKAFQREIGAVPDGIIGKETYRKGMAYYKLTPEAAAHFFGQLACESNSFTVFEENLNYSALGLLATFPKYFPLKSQAEEYAHKPERIANRVYGNRLGNGPESSGDGWKYRGRGAIQLTGRENYSKFAEFCKDSAVIEAPDRVFGKYAFKAAFWFFKANKIFTIANKGVTDELIEQVTRKVNGGLNGIDYRKRKTYEIYNVLKDWSGSSIG